MSAGPSASTTANRRRAAEPLRRFPSRLRERPFWTTQLLIVGITVLHLGSEAITQTMEHEISGTFHHLPVLLYMIPIGYASLAYGLEGAVLTGLWGTILTAPNLVLWHREHLTWFTELVFMAAVVTMGVLMAFPVEAERRQRQRAEASSRRLGLLNHITASTLTAGLESTLDGALRRLADVLELREVRLELEDSSPKVVARHPPASLAEGSDEGEVATVALTASLPDAPPVTGRLVAHLPSGRTATDDDHTLLQSVADHLAVAIASDRIRLLEQEHVRAYARRVLQGQEEERRRIARDLHDESAQNLVVVSRDLASLANASDAESRRGVEQIRQLVAETLAGLRRFSHDLRPPVLEDLGLAAALESLADRVRDRSGIDVRVHVQGEVARLDHEVEIALFRIGQEALNNVVRHAAASTASVDLRFVDATVQLSVTDDGRGFTVPRSVAELTAEGSLGITGMHERAALVGADLSITSEVGRGTRLVLRVPR